MVGVDFGGGHWELRGVGLVGFGWVGFGWVGLGGGVWLTWWMRGLETLVGF